VELKERVHEPLSRPPVAQRLKLAAFCAEHGSEQTMFPVSEHVVAFAAALPIAVTQKLSPALYMEQVTFFGVCEKVHVTLPPKVFPPGTLPGFPEVLLPVVVVFDEVEEDFFTLLDELVFLLLLDELLTLDLDDDFDEILDELFDDAIGSHHTYISAKCWPITW
jgi:hypothetical protein